MELKQIQDYFEANKDNEDLKAYIGGFVTPDRVQSFLEGEEGKKILQPKLDSHFTKGLETWKTNNLQKMIDEEIKKRFPEADPKDVKMKELEAKLESMQKETFRKELANKALKIATEKKLPVEIIDHMLDVDEETTFGNISKFEKIFNETVQKLVEERVKGSSYVPPKGNPNEPDFSKMSDEEYYAYKEQQKNKK